MKRKEEIMPVPATLMHIEDDIEWQEEVQKDITISGKLEFQRYMTVTSIDDALNAIRSISGPLILIIDLRLGNDPPNYNGLDWLDENYPEFKRAFNDVEVFIISGQLNPATQSVLVRKGIPAEHIYDKEKWVETSQSFLTHLRHTAIPFTHRAVTIPKQKPSPISDYYLTSSFEALQDRSKEIETLEIPSQPTAKVVLPMLLHVKADSWQPDKIPDYQEFTRIGDVVACIGSIDTLKALEKDTSIRRIEASRQVGNLECHKSIPFVKADKVHQMGEKGDNVIIGIIDDSIDALNQAFLDATKTHTRIVAIWDQTDSSGQPPDPNTYGLTQTFGTLYTKDQIDHFIKDKSAPLGFLKNNGFHGTHVTSIAAGRDTGIFKGGIAPEAQIVVVIPDLRLGQTEIVRRNSAISLGYSVSHVAALKFIKSISNIEGLPVVINVSQGMNGGAHDGSSILELAFDNLSGGGREPGCVVVKSAGNERKKCCHAKLLMASKSRDTLKWYSRKEHDEPDTIELWFPSSDHLRFRLLDPNNVSSNTVTWMKTFENGVFPSGIEYKISYAPFHVDNGESQLMVRIFPTKRSLIQEGTWTIETESDVVRSAKGEVHAWIERTNDNPIYFIDHIDEEMTLSVPGTARTVICVGAVKADYPYSLADYSSYGPTRDGRQKPDISAPGDEIYAVKAWSKDDVCVLCGTSMAAPHVTGAIALLFSRRAKQKKVIQDWEQYNTMQIQRALIQTTQNFSGSWNPGMGFGVLDIFEFLKVLA